MSKSLTDLHEGQRLLFKFNSDYYTLRGDREIEEESLGELE